MVGSAGTGPSHHGVVEATTVMRGLFLTLLPGSVLSDYISALEKLQSWTIELHFSQYPLNPGFR